MNATQQNGFSLIEIMVGMVIGLLGMIVIMQVFAVSESGKQTTTSGGDAQQKAALSLNTIEHDLRMAGYGINASSALMGCKINGYNATRTPQTFDFVLAPVVITQGTGNLPDIITITYSSSSVVNSPASITQNMPSPSSAYKVNNRYGFTPGDLIVIAESGKDCTLGQVTDTPGGGQSDNVIHNSGNYTNSDGNNVPADYNKPGGVSSINYTTSAKLYNLGPLPINNVYSISSSSLNLMSNLTAANETISDNIVDLQAQYGIDTDGDGEVNEYRNSADLDGDGTTTGLEYSKVLSVRFGLIARSTKREPSCDVTTSVPTWAGGSFNNITANADWQCYRYRVFETTTMLRNMLWTPS
ncbi:MAG TPA: PilW family protein [Methylophilaceae bacterium]|nr:PilW family protein [Methylophilaceae bacterium]